jgi:hypothetical protein
MVIKSKKMRWLEHVAHMEEMTNACSILVGKPKGKRPSQRPRHKWGIILKQILSRTQGCGLNLCGLLREVRGRLLRTQ